MRPRFRPSVLATALASTAALAVIAVATPPARVEAQQVTGALHGAVTARPAAARANVVVSLENVPGTYTLHAWSERLPAVTQQVTVTAGGDAEVRVELRR